MRTPSLQYLYLQKPVTMLVLICALSVLPWLGIESFPCADESGETTAIASQMLETGEWVLPVNESGEHIYKPPMAHWLVAAFSLPQGYVSGYTARLPSALALICLIGFTLFFFGERIKFQEAFITSLLLLTSIGIHRAGMISGTDMLFTTFVVLALYALYRWENKLQLKGLPVSIPILLGCAVLTKGLSGVILPLFVYGIYLITLKKHNLKTICKALLYIGVSSMFLPLLWYVAAWQEQGGDFFRIVMANDYGVGTRRGIIYYLITLLMGFMPWTIFAFFSLFGMKVYWYRTTGRILADIRRHISSLEKIKLFGLVSLLCIFVYYSIFAVKRGNYLLPAYPFVAVFLAQYIIYLTEYRTKVTRVFAIFTLVVACSALVTFVLTTLGVIDTLPIPLPVTFSALSISSIFILLFVLATIVTLIYQLFKKINIKILYATIALIVAMYLFMDSVILSFAA